MGITYKLKKEVVGYILDQKQANSSLSCRKLAEMASEHFHKNISKSSVNSILKETSLSSPVGRRASKKKAPLVFKLPEYRKEQLFQKAPIHLVETPKEVPKVLEPEQSSSDNICALLLKAVQWELCREPLLSVILSKYSDCPLSREIDKISDAFLLMPIFGLKRVEDLSNPEGKALRDFLGIAQPFDLIKIGKVLKSLQGLENNKNQVLLEYSQLFTEIESFKIVLENNTEFNIDARMTSVWTKDNVHSSNCLPLNKALDFLSRNIIVNKSPLIIRNASQEDFSLSLSAMFYAFENIPSYRIKRVDLVDGRKEIVASFDNLLSRKRQMIVGLNADQPEIKQLLGGNMEEKRFSLPFLEQNIVYQVFQATIPIASSPDGIPAEGAVFFVENQPEKKVALITNICGKGTSIERTISLYIERWGGWQNEQEGQSIQKQVKAQENFSLDDKMIEAVDCSAFTTAPFAGVIVKSIIAKLSELARQYFLPPAEPKRPFQETCLAFSSLKGQIKKDENFITARLAAPYGAFSLKDLQYISSRVNQAGIFEPLTGQRLLFVSPSK